MCSDSFVQLAMLASIPSGIMVRLSFDVTAEFRSSARNVPVHLTCCQISIIVTPIEGIKTRQQTRGKSESAAVVVKDVLRRDGVRGLYRFAAHFCTPHAIGSFPSPHNNCSMCAIAGDFRACASVAPATLRRRLPASVGALA